MKRKKPRVKYQGISFETPFIAEIKKHIMFNPRYRSIADFAREAIREKMKEDQSEAMEIFNNRYRIKTDDELVKEFIHEKELSGLSLEELKKEVAFHRELKEKEIKELLQEKKEPVLQLSKDVTDLIQSAVTKTVQSAVTKALDKKEKKE